MVCIWITMIICWTAFIGLPLTCFKVTLPIGAACLLIGAVLAVCTILAFMVEEYKEYIRHIG